MVTKIWGPPISPCLFSSRRLHAGGIWYLGLRRLLMVHPIGSLPRPKDSFLPPMYGSLRRYTKYAVYRTKNAI